MKRFIFAFAAVFILTAAVMYIFPANCEENEETIDCPFVLMETGTGIVIKEQRGNERVSQGSLTKLMTVLIAAEEMEQGKFSADTVINIGDEVSGTSGAVVWLRPGDSMTADELLRSVIIGNANDAAAVLAVYIGKSEKEFVRMMNARAFELGMRDTVYKDCSGMSGGGYTTAHDVSLLSCELLKHEQLRKYFTSWTDKVRDGQTELVNENRLVRTYDGITGLKAGSIGGREYFLVLTAERNGISFAAVLLGCDDKDKRFSYGKKLLSEGFSSYKITAPEFAAEFLRPVEVHGGIESAVMIGAESLKELVVPKYSGELSASVLIPQYVDAPVKKGQRIGVAGFYNGDTLLFETALVAQQTVDKVDFVHGIGKSLDILYK